METKKKDSHQIVLREPVLTGGLAESFILAPLYGLMLKTSI